ncbi:fibronectin [Bacillus cereus]|nr:fibronectin [Bacillus cereus]
MHLPLKIGALHLHIFEEGVFCWKTIKFCVNKNDLDIIIKKL